MKGKGYKVFNSDWSCRDFKYKVGETYEMIDKPEICRKGFHFCTDLKDCFIYYPFDSNKVKIAEIEALGEIDADVETEDTKCCTNKIKIVREISFNQLWFETQKGADAVILSGHGQKRYEAGTVLPFYFLFGVPIIGGITVIKKYPDITSPFGVYYIIEYDAIIDVKEIYNERL